MTFTTAALTEAAHGGLKPSPTGRLRRVLLHLSTAWRSRTFLTQHHHGSDFHPIKDGPLSTLSRHSARRSRHNIQVSRALIDRARGRLLQPTLKRRGCADYAGAGHDRCDVQACDELLLANEGGAERDRGPADKFPGERLFPVLEPGR